MTDSRNLADHANGIDVGIYFDLRNPHQWRQKPARLHGFTLEMCEEAERLGASSLWFSEHHLFDDDYLTSPLTFAAAAAARTSRVRLGTAVVVAPLHHPAEIAEQAVLVDLLSDGRLDLGIGAGYRVPEFELFEADITKRYSATDATARRLRELWRSDGVRPRPVQTDIPIWMGYQGPKGARRAGLHGERLLSADARLWEPYRAGLAEGGFSTTRGRMAGGIQAWATDDPERDWPIVSTHLRHQLDSYRAHGVQGTSQPPPRPVNLDRIINVDRPGPLGSFYYGTPEMIVDAIRRTSAGAPVETVYLWASLSGMPEDMVHKNVELICNKVAPPLASSR
jgi:alkanesulfonate monooxygenase SsuD/methylene tetrahydromethanopterin reductase-like flavin-dependent oxidoreductase (luciferase family)